MMHDSDRRQFMLGASSLLAATRIYGAQAASEIDPRQLHALSAVAAVTAMRRGELKAEDYATALLARAERITRINAFRVLRPDEVLQAAREADKRRAAGARLGVLHGLPLPVKDSVNTRMLPTTNGTRALRDFQPKKDARVLQRLFAQGAILMGKTNLHELSLGWTSNNATFGAVLNPYDLSRSPGGSSGGSAAAVAARIAPLAIAEDTWGSIRVPASFCGLCGLRPTYGRYPDEGIMPLARDKFDQVGPLARSVGDLALFDAAVTGDHTPLRPASLRGVRLGLSPDYHLSGMDKEVQRLTREAVDRLKHEGVIFVPAEFPQAMRDASRVTWAILEHEMPDVVAEFLKQYDTGVTLDELVRQVGPNIAATMERTKSDRGSEAQYRALLLQREQIKALMAAHYRQHNIEAMAFPPVMMPAMPQGDAQSFDIDGHEVALLTAVGRNIAVGSCAGLSCMVLPVGMTAAGLPVGIEFDALPGTDRRLLSLGLAFEKVLGTVPPPGIAA
jgi:Asp-tRNA(Asn)/Glu-tRNA(Gln) amidotransferase A subunit family amidase